MRRCIASKPYDIPWLPTSETQVWQVEARIELATNGGTSQVFLTLPPLQSGFELINEAAASSGWGFAIDSGDEQRRAHWTTRTAQGPQVLFYKLDFEQSAALSMDPPPNAPAPAVHWDEPYATAMSHLLNVVLPLSADPHTRWRCN